MFFGRDLRHNPTFSRAQQMYIALLGYPALGLHVRAHAVLPLIRALEHPRMILDAGSGTGALTFAAARMHPGAQVIGLDTKDPDAQQSTAARLGLHNSRFVQGDAQVIDRPGFFDAIVATDLLEHVHDDTGLLCRFYSWLRPGGFLIVHVPHETRKVFGHSRPNFMGIEGHVRPGYRKNALEKLLTEVGYSIEISRYTYNSFETLFNDISCAITGGRERNKALYALAFPVLLAATRLTAWWPTDEGSGIVVLARRNG